MLQQSDLENNFEDVTGLHGGILRFKDVTPAFTYYYYLLPASSTANWDLLVVSQDRADDGFASSILMQAKKLRIESSLQMVHMDANAYKFSALLLAPTTYHSYFKGRLDQQRQRLVLCLPVHRCEFSGAESVAEFVQMRRDIVQTLNWQREVQPKIVLRFYNPRTGSGTGDGAVLVRWTALLAEIANLDGVTDGFLEITNYAGHLVEVVSPASGNFRLIRDRDDRNSTIVDRARLITQILQFLTT